jgi:hypothetical protein
LADTFSVHEGDVFKTLSTRGTMRRILISTLGVAGLLSASPDALHAQYLDPGSSSILIQVLLGGLVGIAAVLKFYWSKIRGVLSWSKKPPRDGA